MSQIKLLPENLINQIAAGEVIERPASVVKELLENSLDAGAKRIIVEVNEGGDTFLRVTDDGIGMDQQDAVMAFERHATSKILTTEDLFRIRTLGFRGEAIASIASVSYLTLQTKLHGKVEGTIVISEGGKIDKVKTIGAPEGTQIEVKNLFFNTPVRKKYLKNVATEFGHILDTITGIALSFPEVAFKLIHDNKVVFDLPQVEDTLSRIRSMLGRNIADELVPVFYGHADFKLTGFIGKPNIARAGRGSQYLFVNRREVKSHVLSYAVKQSYYSLLPKERNPVFLLYFDINPMMVDVNVHPRKQEVRFKDEKEIFKIILLASKKALETHVLAPVLDYEQNRTHQAPLKLADQIPKPADFVSFSSVMERVAVGSDEKEQNISNAGEVESEKSAVAAQNLSSAAITKSVTKRATDEEILPIAQLANSYILCQQGSRLVIVDQHAAHERIRYTEIVEEFEARQKPVQPLLLPLQLELSHQEIAVLKENYEIIKGLGFELEEFGGNTFSIYAIPSYLAKFDLKTVIMGLIDDLKNNASKGDLQNRKEKALVYMACRSAVKFGDKLSDQEQESLLKKLQTLALPYTCPHGRPTMITMSFDELERRFGRKY